MKDNFGYREQGDFVGLYKFLFENDLKQTKDKAVEQLESLREKHDQNIKDLELLKLENQDFKNSIRRYIKMIKDF